MSWSSGAEAAGESGAAAGSAGSGASSLGSMGSTGSIYGQMANVGGTAGEGAGAASGAGGFSSALDGAGSQGPSMASQYADTGSGAASGSMMDRAMNGLDQFQKGGQQSLPEAYKGWGNNPATYGYVAGKLQSMGGGGAPQAPNMTTNISYQQPQNDYLMKQRRRF